MAAIRTIVDDLRREVELRPRRVHYVDVGVSGGLRGLERGDCLMIGGESTVVRRLEPNFRTLAPGRDSAARLSTGDGSSTAEEGFLYEGRWAVQAAIDAGGPTPALSAALYERFSSRGEGEFAAKLLSATRFEFGGHEEKE